MSTLILPAPAGELPDETVTLDVNALRKHAIRHLLDLADEHNLPWPREIVLRRRVNFPNVLGMLDIHLDDDEPDALAAWASALGVPVVHDRGLFNCEPYIARCASSYDVPGWFKVEICTFLHPARDLPEQGPNPADEQPAEVTR